MLKSMFFGLAAAILAVNAASGQGAEEDDFAGFDVILSTDAQVQRIATGHVLTPLMVENDGKLPCEDVSDLSYHRKLLTKPDMSAGGVINGQWTERWVIGVCGQHYVQDFDVTVDPEAVAGQQLKIQPRGETELFPAAE